MNDLDEQHFGGQNGFMQINLPVHEAATYQEFFNGINGLFLDYQVAVFYGQHLDDAVVTNDSFRNASKKTIAIEIIHAIDVQLTRDELVKKFLLMLIGEN